MVKEIYPPHFLQEGRHQFASQKELKGLKKAQNSADFIANVRLATGGAAFVGVAADPCGRRQSKLQNLNVEFYFLFLKF